METTFRVTATVRNQFLNFINNYTLEQLNHIPTGFSNNSIWNIGHCIATQQLLVYKLSSLPMNVSDEFIETYRNGSFSTGKTTQEEVNYIKSILFSSYEKIQEDLSNNVFVTTYNEYTTKTTGFTLQNVQQALEFNNFHEGLHYGVLLQIKKFL